jgi:hypothetical protein
MMTLPAVALYRLDFRLDLTSAVVPTINLGYMLETALEDGFRFLGLVSRKSLTPLELDQVDQFTWPELASLDAYMEKVFQHAWEHVCGAEIGDGRLGSEHVAQGFSTYTALHFASEAFDTLKIPITPDVDALQEKLYSSLIGLGKKLKPIFTAPVLEFPLPVTYPTSTRAKEERLEMAA